MSSEKTDRDTTISEINLAAKPFRQAYTRPELYRFGAITQLTASGSKVAKEENTGADCDNNATRYGTQPCTKP